MKSEPILILTSQNKSRCISNVCISKSDLQPVVVGNGDVLSPLVSDENRERNHSNPRRRAFKLTGLERDASGSVPFLCLFPSSIVHISRLDTSRPLPCESKTRALHIHYGSLSTNIMHHRRWLLCGLSLEFYIWPSKPLLAGWVMTVTSLFPCLCCSLCPSFCLSFCLCSQGFLLVGLRIRFLTTTSLEDTATLV